MKQRFFTLLTFIIGESYEILDIIEEIHSIYFYISISSESLELIITAASLIIRISILTLKYLLFRSAKKKTSTL